MARLHNATHKRKMKKKKNERIWFKLYVGFLLLGFASRVSTLEPDTGLQIIAALLIVIGSYFIAEELTKK
jgi:hypothetical protein